MFEQMSEEEKEKMRQYIKKTQAESPNNMPAYRRHGRRSV